MQHQREIVENNRMNFIHPFSLLFFQLQFYDKCNIITIFHFQIHVERD